MTKTLDEYLSDPDLAGEPEALREVHAIRLLIHDETKGMTAAEHTAYFHEAAARLLVPDASTPGSPESVGSRGGSLL